MEEKMTVRMEEAEVGKKVVAEGAQVAEFPVWADNAIGDNR